MDKKGLDVRPAQMVMVNLTGYLLKNATLCF